MCQAPQIELYSISIQLGRLLRLRKDISGIRKGSLCVVSMSEVNWRHCESYLYDKMNKDKDDSIIIHIFCNYLVFHYDFYMMYVLIHPESLQAGIGGYRIDF